MSIDFTQHQTVIDLVNQIPEGKEYSDIVDAKGNQYVDLVQEGGGVLGIALVGYTYILEKAGIRFMSLAGTSAGAINTMMMAGLGKIQEKKSEKILSILSDQDLFDLVDGHPSIGKIIDKVIKKEKGIVWLLIWNAKRIFKTMKKKLGLNPGTYFEDWITRELNKNNIHTINDLMELRKILPEGLKYTVDNSEVTNIEAKLAIITSDITTHTKAEFPKMKELYWENSDMVSPAKLVRASMSIPYFFEPLTVNNIPNKGEENNTNWKNFASYSGPVPPSVKFVDGGMLSNFPIDVFHRKDASTPRMPTFGARLSTYREKYSETDSTMGMSMAMISTMRQIHDYDFLLKNPDFKLLICRIKADKDFNWLDFNMTKAQQIDLFILGAEKALEFLKGFNWSDYKKERAKGSS